MKIQTKRLFVYLLPLVFCVLSLCLAFFLTPSYIHNYCASNLPDGSSETHCNYDNFSGIQLKFIIFALIWFSAFIVLLIFRKELFSLNLGKFKFSQAVTRFRKDYIENKLHYWILLIVVAAGIITRVFFLYTPMKGDEAATYVWYASWPVYISQSLYTFPNNHLFHTLLVNVSTNLFGSSEIAIRLPAFIFGVLNILLAYHVGRKFFNKHIGILLCSFVAASGYLIEFSVEARGYSIITFFALLSLIFVRKILTENELKHWLLLALCIALSIYTIPSMVYFAALIVSWILLEMKSKVLERASLKNLFLFCCTAGFTVVILYYPVVLLSGVKSIIANPVVKSQSFSYIFSNIPSYIVDLLKSPFINFPGHPLIWAALSVTGLVLFNTSKDKSLKKKPLVSLLNIFVPIIFALMLVQRVLPFVRTYVYLFPLFYLALCLVIYYICRQIPAKNQMVFSAAINLFCIIIVVLGTYKFVQMYEDNFNYIGDTRSSSMFLQDHIGEAACFIVQSDGLVNSYEYYLTKEGYREKHCIPEKKYDTIYSLRNPQLPDYTDGNDYLDGYSVTDKYLFDRIEVWMFKPAQDTG